MSDGVPGKTQASYLVNKLLLFSTWGGWVLESLGTTFRREGILFKKHQ